MRIAYLTGQYPRVTDTFIQREVAVLREKGVEVQTFSIRRPGDEHIVGPEQKAEREQTYYILPIAPIALIAAHLNLVTAAPGNYLRAIKLAWKTRQPALRGLLYQLFYFLEAGLLANEIRKREIQHLHNHFADSSCSVAMLAAELGDFTFSFTLHGSYIFFEPYRWRLDEKIKRALFVSCISYFCRSQGMFFAPTNKWKQMHIVHCGVNPDLFEVVSHTHTKNLLYVGRLAAGKGLPVLFESLVQLQVQHPDVKLTIVGDGPDRPELEKLVTAYQLNELVEFVGNRSQSEVRQYLQQADLFVLPSFAEGLPVVLIEALAAGVPVVATRIAGISELVEDGVSGYLVPPSAVDALTDRLDTLLSNPEMRMQMGRAGRAKVQQEFDIYKEVDWLHRILASALEGRIEATRPEYNQNQILREQQEATIH